MLKNVEGNLSSLSELLDTGSCLLNHYHCSQVTGNASVFHLDVCTSVCKKESIHFSNESGTHIWISMGLKSHVEMYIH